jgi:hypothetical protein
MSAARALRLRGLAVLAVIAIIGCTPTETKPLKLEDTKQITATVTKIDLSKRLLEVKNPAGEIVTVQVSPAVRNLGQVKVGDQVTVKYYQALGAEIMKADAPSGEAAIELGGGRAPEGERPAALLGARIAVPVTIDSVDTKSNTVTFHAEDGLVRSIQAKTPQGQAFIKQLKTGDHVVVTYEEAVAASVEPAPESPPSP